MDLDEYIKALRNWKNQNDKNILDILKRINVIKSFQTEEMIAELRDTIILFHKEINKADAVCEDWFKEVLKVKKNIKKLEEDFKKKLKTPNIVKRDSKIQYPASLCESKDERQKTILRSLYKNFVLNLREQILMRSKQIVEFLHNLLDSLYQTFDLKKASLPDTQLQDLFDRLDKINGKFHQPSSVDAKLEMIEGKKSAKTVAEMSEDAFLTEEGKRRLQKKLLQVAREKETGFYDEMKKNINKDAHEQCRYCHKKSAYCQQMKQIRAADEPMTRFMYCNSCTKRWRCE